MKVWKLVLCALILGIVLLAQSAIAATIVAASDASATSKASAQYICDGVNDQVELNNALARGGEVVMTEGTFRTSGTIVVKGNTVFRGQGPGKTVLSMAGDYGARVDISQPDVTVKDFKITQRGWLMITTSRVKVHDVTIQDSKKTAPTVNGMFFVWASNTACEDIEFIRCKAIDVGSTGFNLNGQGSPRVNRNIRFDDCLALRCGNAGSGKIWAVGFDFHEGADLYDLTVTNCRAEDCWESGFYFEPNFWNGNDPNRAIPVQVNSRLSNCVAVNNGWRNTEPTRFYMTGYYLTCGVTVTNCVSVNSRNNGFWLWQNSKDVILNGCTDDGSDKSFQVRTGTNLRFNDCISKNARTHALYMWGSSGVVFDKFRIINPKKSSGAVSLGLREDHPNDPWPVTGCTLDILLTGGDPGTLVNYYNAKNNKITINGDTSEIPTGTVTPIPVVSGDTTPTPTQVPEGELPSGAGNGVIPGTIEVEDYDGGGQNVGYFDTTPENEGGAYRSDGVDIEYSAAAGGNVVGYNRPGEWLQYTVEVKETGTYQVSLRAASPNSDTSLKFLVDGKETATFAIPNTGNWYTFADVKTTVTLSKGEHVLRLSTGGYHNLDRMTFSTSGTVTSTTTATPTQPTIPGAAAIPGLIEAENYNSGGEGVAYHDTTPQNEGGEYRQDGVDIEMASSEGSYVVGWVRPGEWLKYSVNVATEGVYDVSFRVSSPNSDGSFRMQVDGTDVCTVMVPNTGNYNSYTTVVQQVSLPAGGHTIRLYFNGYTNLNWMKFQTNTGITQGTATPTATPTVTATSGQGLTLPAPLPTTYGSGVIPGVIQAEDYNIGGQNVGYYDTTSSNFGGIYRNEDVDVELADGGDDPVVCWVRPGEWLKYTVNVRQTGDYDVVFRVSSPNANTQMRLQVDGVQATTFTVPKTGSYQTYTDVTQTIPLKAGPHVLRLVLGGYHNINYMAFTPSGSTAGLRSLAPETVDMTPVSTVNVTPTATVDMTPVSTVNATPAATVDMTPVSTVNATPAATVDMTPVSTVNATPTATVDMTPVSTATATPAATVDMTPVSTATATPAATVESTPVSTATATPAATVESTPVATANATPELTTVRLLPARGSPPVGTTAGPVVTVTQEPPVVTTEAPSPALMELVLDDRNLSTFARLAQEAGLNGNLGGDEPLTVFAPTDEAFDALPDGALEGLRSDPARLAAVLGFHLAPGRFTSGDLDRMTSVETLDGLEASIVIRPDGVLAIAGAGMNATDRIAGNGVLHVVDAVMLPLGWDTTPTTDLPTPSEVAGGTPGEIPEPAGTATSLPEPGVPDAVNGTGEALVPPVAD